MPYPHGRITSRAYWNKWDRCVKKVKSRCRSTGSCPDSAYAVCHHALRGMKKNPVPRETHSSADPWIALGATALGMGALVWLISSLPHGFSR